jgi:competence protein ComEA
MKVVCILLAGGLLFMPFLAARGAAPTTETKKAMKAPQAPPPVIDINRASAQDFEKLPGIGPVIAGQIVAYREKHGPFRRVQDLLAVRRIGHKTWKEIRPYLKVSDGEGREGEEGQKSKVKSQK